MRIFLFQKLQMEKEANRLATFSTWPATGRKTPSELAYEGFFYLNDCDRVECAFCGKKLRNWEFFDDPHRDHLKHSPTCPRAKRSTTNNVPIAFVFPSLQEIAARIIEPLCKQYPTTETTELPQTVISFMDELFKESRRINSLRCRYCKIDLIGTIFLPCNHAVSCRTCSSPGKKCPLCKVTISTVLTCNIY